MEEVTVSHSSLFNSHFKLPSIRILRKELKGLEDLAGHLTETTLSIIVKEGHTIKGRGQTAS